MSRRRTGQSVVGVPCESCEGTAYVPPGIITRKRRPKIQCLNCQKKAKAAAEKAAGEAESDAFAEGIAVEESRENTSAPLLTKASDCPSYPCDACRHNRVCKLSEERAANQ